MATADACLYVARLYSAAETGYREYHVGSQVQQAVKIRQVQHLSRKVNPSAPPNDQEEPRRLDFRLCNRIPADNDAIVFSSLDSKCSWKCYRGGFKGRRKLAGGILVTDRDLTNTSTKIQFGPVIQDFSRPKRYTEILPMRMVFCD